MTGLFLVLLGVYKNNTLKWATIVTFISPFITTIRLNVYTQATLNYLNRPKYLTKPIMLKFMYKL